MLTLDTKGLTWIPVSLAARQVDRSSRQIYRYIKDRNISAATFSGSQMTFVDIDELRAFLGESVQCAGCSVVFKRSGKRKYHSPKCRLNHYATKRR